MVSRSICEQNVETSVQSGMRLFALLAAVATHAAIVEPSRARHSLSVES